MCTDPVVSDDLSGIIVTGAAQHAAWQRREMPPVEQIAGGLWSIPVPIPDNPLRYTLSYLIPGSDGVVVVDPGWRSEAGWRALVDGLAEADTGVDDVVGIVITHAHPDHHGLSEHLRAASGAWVAMHPDERNMLSRPDIEGRPDGSLDRVRRLLHTVGAPVQEIATMLGRFDRPDTPRIEDLVEPDLLLADGDLVPLPGRRLRAVWTPGHTPGHLCLQEPDARLLLTGDHVLPRITPNIGLRPDTPGSPLPRFLESLHRIAEYDDHEALPAHEYRFRGLAARTRRLREHHQQRCGEILAAVRGLGTPTLWQLAQTLTWSRSWTEIGHMQVAAVAETAAHASHLVDQGELTWLGDGGLTNGEQPARLQRVS